MNTEVAALAQQLRNAFDSTHTDKAQRADVIGALLHEHVRALALGRESIGREVALQELLVIAEAADQTQLRWQVAESQDSQALLVAEAVADQPQRGYLLTVSALEGRIGTVTQQRTAPIPPAATALVLPEPLCAMINSALKEQHPMLMAYVDLQGQPQLSFRGSVQVHGSSALALWARNAAGGFIAAIGVNPMVSFMYRNESTRATYQLRGRARVETSTAQRRAIFESLPKVERDHDFAMAGAAVVVELDSVEGYAGLGAGGQIERIRLLREPLKT